MPVRKIINSFRYNVYLVLLAFLIAAGALSVLVENQMLANGAKDIFRLDRQLKDLQSKVQARQKMAWLESQAKLKASSKEEHRPDKPVVDFEGIYQQDGAIFAIVNGKMLKAGEVSGSFELKEISLQKVVFRNTKTNEETVFDLYKDVNDFKGIKFN